jgi:hypothetical protein
MISCNFYLKNFKLIVFFPSELLLEKFDVEGIRKLWSTAFSPDFVLREILRSDLGSDIDSDVGSPCQNAILLTLIAASDWSIRSKLTQLISQN